jgi:hypothetical protein
VLGGLDQRTWQILGGEQQRRSAVSMSANDTACLAWYQGARARQAATSTAGWPWVAYQTTVSDRHSKPKGTVRSTARRVRLRACPTPTTYQLASKATSICQRSA